MGRLRSIYNVLSRKKIVNDAALAKSDLAKCLTTLDLTALSIGSTLGVGVYVLAGQVAKNVSGPAVVLSFFIAALASVFAGLCYAEFGARVPKAGSAYIYSYVCVGEFVAFIIGWNLILEYVIGAASVVKGMSNYIDPLVDKKISKFFKEYMPMNIDNFAEYPDFFAFGITMVFTTAVAFGAKESTLVNNIFTLVNLSVVLFVVIAGSIKANPSNWALESAPSICGKDKEESCGSGGFAPYGVTGIIKGAASCFYGFIGFDTIATAGEEAKTPQKSIPLATVLSLFIIFLAYFSISTVLTMMQPYYDQDTDRPLPAVFEKVGWGWAGYAVSVGAICGLCSSLFGALFPLPRIIYAMAKDGLIFKFLSKINEKYQTPFLGTFLAGLLTGIMSAIFDLEQLFTMMSIGTLLAYSMVAACVLILRYDYDEEENEKPIPYGAKDVFKQMFNWKLKDPSKLTGRLTTWTITTYAAFCLILGAWLSQLENELSEGKGWAVAGLVILVIILIVLAVSISLQPVSKHKLTFQVPFVPWIPCISIMINLYLMTKLDAMTWVRFIVWIAIGLVIYFGYGIKNSTQRKGALIENENSIEESSKTEGNTNEAFVENEELYEEI